MKKIVLITLSIGTLLSFAACNKYLDIYPDDKLIYEQIIGSEPAINNVLNGIYMNMAQNNLYGSNLSMTLIEVMAQQYNLSRTTEHIFLNHSQYKYDEDNVKSIFSTIWEKMYVQVLDVNDFMKIVEEATVTIPKERKDILLGEAYALRAFHHFDLLRLYGPVYSQDSTNQSIPYNTDAGGTMQPLLPANEVIEKILADLSTAEDLLKNDRVITLGIETKKSMDPVADFYINRHYRMNYYAVKALQARVHLWRGDKPAALAAAYAVLNASLVQSGNLFNWIDLAKLNGTSPDRILSSEIIFGIHNRNMYSLHDTYFAGGAAPKNELCPDGARLDAVYDSGDDNDVRFGKMWSVPGGVDKTYKTFNKYAKPAAMDTTFTYFQPLIRKSELYYIVAECELDPAAAAQALTDVVKHRNLMSPGIAVATSDEILKEYRKEFYGEGVLFFYYKRLNFLSIPDGNSSNPLTMNATTYRVPLPLNEQEVRN